MKMEINVYYLLHISMENELRGAQSLLFYMIIGCRSKLRVPTYLCQPLCFDMRLNTLPRCVCVCVCARAPAQNRSFTELQTTCCCGSICTGLFHLLGLSNYKNIPTYIVHAYIRTNEGTHMYVRNIVHVPTCKQ